MKRGVNMSQNLSEKISKFRKERGYSQNELAKLADIPQSAISEIETGNRENPGVLTIKKLAKALNVSLADLLDESITPKNV